MRKLILYIAMSLDGYLEDAKGGVDFLKGDDSSIDNFGSYDAFLESIDTIILGFTTYHQVTTQLSPDLWPYEGKQTFVLTHRKLPSTTNITMCNESLDAIVSELKTQPGKNIWLCGGAALVRDAINHNLVDTYCISVIPTLLGDGIPLFSKQDQELKLELVSTKTYNGIVDLVYERRKPTK